MRVKIRTNLPAPSERVRELVIKPATLFYISSPILRFRAQEPPPETFETMTYVFSMFAFGFIPLGRQAVVVERPASHPEASDGAWILRDNGHGQLVQRWDHYIFISDGENETTDYTDFVDVDASWLTPLIAGFAHVFYRWRQHRWRRLLTAGQ
ncbi:MAG: hypothetical protein AAFX94_17745 [Myxococcota bacterium]